MKAAWSEVLNQYQRRADLVPNLVNTVKGAVRRRRTFSTAWQSARQGDLHPGDAGAHQRSAGFPAVAGGAGRASSALSRLMVVAERYPDLKSISGFNDLRAQLEGTENRITVARKRYIDGVQRTTSPCARFPTNLTAKMFGHKVSELHGGERGEISQAAGSGFRHAAPRRRAEPRSRVAGLTRRARAMLAALALPRAALFAAAAVRSPRARAGRRAAAARAGHRSDRNADARADRRRSSRSCALSKQRKGSQIAVLIVPTTQPEAIEQYSIRVVEAGSSGVAGVDDGVLLLVAKDDRAVRIEVGYGLEGALPDVIANRIIEQVIVPRFAGRFLRRHQRGRRAHHRGDRGRGAAGARRGSARAERRGARQCTPAVVIGVRRQRILRRMLGAFGGASRPAGSLVLVWVLTSTLGSRSVRP